MDADSGDFAVVLRAGGVFQGMAFQPADGGDRGADGGVRVRDVVAG